MTALRPANRETRVQLSTHLSPREREILELRRDDLAWKEVADRLHISQNTVKSHVSRAFAKLGVRSSLGAVRALAA